MKRLTASAPVMKKLNRSAILSLIREAGEISRSEVAVRTGLTKPTVTNLVNELLDEGLVVETGRGQSTGGRKPIFLQLNPEARCILGVDVGIHLIRIVALDLHAKVLASHHYDIDGPVSREGFLSLLGDSIGDVLHRGLTNRVMDKSRVLGIGIGMHGIVDAKLGTAIFAPHLRLGEVHIREYLTARFGVDVWVDNDVRAMAAGEHWFGEAQTLTNFVYVNVGDGVGAAIVLEGDTLSGVSGSAGEIGHIVAEPAGALCACGKHGCLETVCSGPSIANRAKAAIAAGAESCILELAGENPDEITGFTVFQAAEQGDALAESLFESAGVHLGRSIATLVNLLNPEAVIIGGGVSRAGRHLFDPMLKSIDEHALEIARGNVKIMPCSLAENATSIGAASMVLQSIFSPVF